MAGSSGTGGSSGTSSGTGSGTSSRAPSAAAGRAPSPFAKPQTRIPGPPRPGDADAPEQPRHGGPPPPLRGRRRVAAQDGFRPPDAQLDPQAALLLGSPHDSGAMGGGGGGSGTPALGSPREQPAASWHSCLTREPLLLFTLLGVAAGILLGVALRPAHLSPQASEAQARF